MTTLRDTIIEKVRRGVPLEGTYFPKQERTKWRLGRNKVHARAVNDAVAMGLLRVEAGQFPFTNGRRAFYVPPVFDREKALENCLRTLVATCEQHNVERGLPKHRGTGGCQFLFATSIAEANRLLQAVGFVRP